MCIELLETILIILKEHGLNLRQEPKVIQHYVICVSIERIHDLLGAENIKEALIASFYDLVRVDNQACEDENRHYRPKEGPSLFIPGFAFG